MREKSSILERLEQKGYAWKLAADIVKPDGRVSEPEGKVYIHTILSAVAYQVPSSSERIPQITRTSEMQEEGEKGRERIQKIK